MNGDISIVSGMKGPIGAGICRKVENRDRDSLIFTMLLLTRLKNAILLYHPATFVGWMGELSNEFGFPTLLPCGCCLLTWCWGGSVFSAFLLLWDQSAVLSAPLWQHGKQCLCWFVLLSPISKPAVIEYWVRGNHLHFHDGPLLKLVPWMGSPVVR